AQAKTHRKFSRGEGVKELRQKGKIIRAVVSLPAVGLAGRGLVGRLVIDAVQPGAKIIARELGDARRVVVDGGGIIRRGDKRLSARGRKGVLIRKPKAVRRNFPGRNA